jgi:hypothetical protein
MDQLVGLQWAAVPARLHLKHDFVEHIHKYRAVVNGPPLVATAQLYAITGNASAVDQQLRQLCQQGTLRLVPTHLPKPSVLVVKMEDYYTGDDALLSKFKAYVAGHNFSTELKSELLAHFTPEELSQLQGKGYLALVPRDVDSLSLAVPNMGFTIKLLHTSQTLVVRLLNAAQGKQLEYAVLKEKWHRNKAWFKDFKGLSLKWCIHYLVGEGLVEWLDSTGSIGSTNMVKLVKTV